MFRIASRLTSIAVMFAAWFVLLMWTLFGP